MQVGAFSVKNWIFAVALMPLGIVLASNGALADCTADGAAAGSTVTCSGTDADGYNNANNTLTVDVASGATVNDAAGNSSIDLVDGNTITNNGTITAVNVNGIDASDNNTITNNAAISSTANDAIKLSSNNTVANSGTLTAQDDGIDLSDTNTVINSGLITATDDGIDARDGLTFTNTGTVTATDKAVTVRNNLVLNNSGTLTSTTDNAIDADLNTVITNSGTIRSNALHGVNLMSGSVTNTGTIAGNDCGCGAAIYVDDDLGLGSGPVVIDNRGTLTGSAGIVSVDSTLNLEITNSGSIISSNNEALVLGSGNDRLTVQRGSAIDGTINLGTGTDTLATGPGLNAYFEYATAVPETIELSTGQVYVASGLTAVVYSPSAISFAGSGLNQVLSGLSVPLGDPTTDIATRRSNTFKSTKGSAQTGWQSGFVGAALTDEVNSTRYAHLYYGAIAGRDISTNDNGSLGVFVGASGSTYSNTSQIEKTASTHFVAGAYRNWGSGQTRNAVSAAFGLGQNNSTRRVSDAGSATGFSNVTGAYRSNSVHIGYKRRALTRETEKFTSYTEIKISTQVTWSGGFSETGATTNATFGSERTLFGDIKLGRRNVFTRLLNAEGQLSTSYGGFAQRQVGDARNGTILATGFSTAGVNSTSFGAYFETVYERPALKEGVIYVGLSSKISSGLGFATEARIGFDISFLCFAFLTQTNNFICDDTCTMM
jgi:hypothetical protein